jgi:formate dehydrogenase major subunit
VTSRHGRIELPVEVTFRVRPGELFATFHNPEARVNLVTSPHRDRFVKACEYKVTAVRVENTKARGLLAKTSRALRLNRPSGGD